MKNKEVSVQYKSHSIPRMRIDVTKASKEGPIQWSIGGLMRLKADGDLEVGILAESKENGIALFELQGLFATKDFDPSSKDDVAIVREIVFAFLFPYLRSTVNQAFSLAGFPIEPFPIIYVRDFFGKVALMIEDSDKGGD